MVEVGVNGTSKGSSAGTKEKLCRETRCRSVVVALEVGLKLRGALGRPVGLRVTLRGSGSRMEAQVRMNMNLWIARHLLP